MSDLYSITRGQEAIRRLFGVERHSRGNLPPHLPRFPASIVRAAEVDRVRKFAMAGWGMPSSQKAIFDAASR